MIFAAVAFVGPALQIVIVAHSFDIGIQLVRAAEDASLVGMHSKRLPTAGDFAFAIANDDYRCVAGFIHIDSINASTLNRESQVGSIDLEIFVTIQMPHANAQRAFGQLQLNGVVIEIQKRKTSVAAETN